MITGKQYCEMVISGCNHISNQKAAINALNVFPVPDGDTGTNMSLTISAASKELKALNDNCTIGEASDRAAGAMLKGARGNSGVILSLLFRGISKGLKGKETADAKDLAAALDLGVKAAYRAVMKPTEGTVLTVSRVACERLLQYVESGVSAVEALEYYVNEANQVLAETPEMLPQLKQAGVVDAGGKGFAVVMEGALSALKGQPIEPAEVVETVEDTIVDDVALREEDIKFAYCTEYIVTVDETAKKHNPAELRSYLESIGDSVVCVPDNDIIKVHVHTNHPGKAIEEAIRYGMLVNLKIDNMKEEFRARQKEEAAKGPAIAENEKRYGFVSVVAGAGLADLCRELGVDTVVEGGQTMNPSTADILAAVNATPSEIVFVLPNNKNIIMAAEQAKELSTAKQVVVIPTKTVPQGISAMLGFDESMEPEEIQEAMAGQIEMVKTAQVTYAARDSVYDDQEIKEGQLLGLMETKVTFVEDDMQTLVGKLFEQLTQEGGSYINIYYGEDVTEEDAMKVQEQVQAMVPDAEVICLAGGQPVYHYIFSVE